MKIKLLSLNFWGLPWPLSKHRKIRMRGLIKFLRMGNFDVIGLQEVWFRKDIKTLKRNFPGYHFIHNSGKILNRSGLLIMSKLNLEEKSFIVFKENKKVSKKGMLISKINNINFIDTHLHFAPEREENFMWKKQINQIKSVLKVKGKTIIFGDFNADYENLNFPGFKVISETKKLTMSRLNKYFDERYDEYTIDFILANFNLKVRKKKVFDSLEISDHYPVFCEIEF